jgi:hypothetical protein
LLACLTCPSRLQQSRIIGQDGFGDFEYEVAGNPDDFAGHGGLRCDSRAGGFRAVGAFEHAVGENRYPAGEIDPDLYASVEFVHQSVNAAKGEAPATSAQTATAGSADSGRRAGLAVGNDRRRAVSFLIADLSGRSLVRLVHVPLDGAIGSPRDGDEAVTVLPFGGGPAEQALRTPGSAGSRTADEWMVLVSADRCREPRQPNDDGVARLTPPSDRRTPYSTAPRGATSTAATPRP